MAEVIYKVRIKRYGSPGIIHSDQGKQFESKLFRDMCTCTLLQVDKTRTTPYHPQSDGMVKRMKRTI